MKRNEIFLKSSDNETNIHMVIWEPEGKIYGILQVNHGISEHILRYDEMATFLNKGGLVVVGIDFIGHGSSTNSKNMYFGSNGSYKYLIEDINNSVSYVRQLYNGVPYIMLGYDMGAYLSILYSSMYGNNIDGIILSSISYKSKFKIKSILNKINKEIKKKGDKENSLVIDKVLSSYNKKYKDSNSRYGYLLKSDIKRQEYINDNLCNSNISLGIVREILNSILDIDVSKIDSYTKSKPLYIIYGLDDIVCNYGKDIVLLDKYLKKNGYTDITLKGYEGLRHDILHEDIRYDIYNDIYGYIVNKLLRSVAFGNDQVLTNGVKALDDSKIKAMQEDSLRRKQENNN